jgi:hypothetical protein
MKNILIILIVSFVTIFTSCSTMKQSIVKNKRLTEKKATFLLNSNGNVFYLYSTYSTFSTVWSYRNDTIEIYRLAKGKLINKEEYKNAGITSFKKPSIKDLDSDINKCGIVLDGDIFGFEFNKNTPPNLYNQITTDLECFKTQKYQSQFLNKLVEDVNTYKLWDVQ